MSFVALMIGSLYVMGLAYLIGSLSPHAPSSDGWLLLG
jgi:hypothetical protein